MSHYYSKTHIPPKTAFVLGTQPEEKGDKKHEIDMPNANPKATIIPLLALGSFALLCLHYALGLELGRRRFLGPNIANAKRSHW